MISDKLLAYAAGGVLAAALVVGGLTYVNHLRTAVKVAEVAEAVAKANATSANAQSGATTAAAVIADRGARRDALSITLHEEHAHDLQAAPGADAPVDPGLVAATRSRLCDYAAYQRDPACAELRVAHPAQLP